MTVVNIIYYGRTNGVETVQTGSRPHNRPTKVPGQAWLSGGKVGGKRPIMADIRGVVTPHRRRSRCTRTRSRSSLSPSSWLAILGTKQHRKPGYWAWQGRQGAYRPKVRDAEGTGQPRLSWHLDHSVCNTQAILGGEGGTLRDSALTQHIKKQAKHPGGLASGGRGLVA